MGKGDKRTKRGKIYRGTYGKPRRPANRPKKERLCPPMPAAAPQPTEANAGTEAK